MKANTFSWYIKRFMAMNLSEVAWRSSMVLKKILWKKKSPNYKGYIEFSKIETTLSKTINSSYYPNEIIEEANLYLDHQWLFFGLKNCNEESIDWHKDPVSKLSAPLKFGFDINHRDEELVGNIKNTWEKNRHHHLTVLAQAYYLTKEEKYAREVETQLQDWVNTNPFLIGVNWTHPLEQGIRLISWVYIYKFLQGYSGFDNLFGVQGFMWKSVYEHQEFIEQTYSRGSSANNHLIGEMAGLFIASKVWPIYKKSSKWQNLSRRILEKELKSQNYSDGINKELGFSYQLFVAQFGILCLNEDDSFSPEFKHIITKMIQFIKHISLTLGILPNYGDGDEGMALQLDPVSTGQMNWLSQLSRDLLRTKTELQKEENIFSKEAGLFAMSRTIGGNKIGVLFDCGPLGLGSMAAHGHADALSFTLAMNHKDIFVDPGTYCYHDDLEYRQYFRSTKAHNTINVDDEDQSKQAGPFLWSEKAKCHIIEYDISKLTITASHDGYSKKGILHKRSIELNNRSLNIDDEVIGSGEHKIEIRFHIHPEVKLQQSANQFKLTRNEESLLLIADSYLKCNILEGDASGGWYSPIFGIKQPTKTIVLTQTLSLPAFYRTTIEIIKK